MKWELIESDGYDISRELFDTYEEAYQSMKERYNDLNDNEDGDEWDEGSYLNDDGGLLYAGGYDVFVWAIFENK